MIITLIIISLSYFILITWLIIGFNKIKKYPLKKIADKNRFSIIIPFRNEEFNLPNLIKSINNINYDTTKYEILFIDDSSTDNSVKIIESTISKQIRYTIYKNIQKSNSPKKDAITTAIKFAKNEWIVTTDADCCVNSLWLKTFNSYIEDKKNIVFIAAPVNYKNGKKFIETFQKIDFVSLIGTTIGCFGYKKPIMCNGANLCYTKKGFYKVNGFVGNNKIASGDDVFLMEKMTQKYPKGVEYLKSVTAIVTTKPEKTLKNLIEQRIRWASKTGNSKNRHTLIIGTIVFAFNAILSISLLWYLLKDLNTFYTISLLWVLKISMDYILISKTTKLFNDKIKNTDYFLTAILHPYFITVISVFSMFKKYEWKNRTFYK